VGFFSQSNVGLVLILDWSVVSLFTADFQTKQKNVIFWQQSTILTNPKSLFYQKLSWVSQIWLDLNENKWDDYFLVTFEQACIFEAGGELVKIASSLKPSTKVKNFHFSDTHGCNTIVTQVKLYHFLETHNSNMIVFGEAENGKNLIYSWIASSNKVIFFNSIWFSILMIESYF